MRIFGAPPVGEREFDEAHEAELVQGAAGAARQRWLGSGRGQHGVGIINDMIGTARSTDAAMTTATQRGLCPSGLEFSLALLEVRREMVGLG